MIDRTNVGISPLLSAPMESYVTTPGLTTDVFAQPATLTTDAFAQPLTYTTDAFATPTTFTTGSLPLISTTPVLDQGLTLPATTTTLLPDTTSALITTTPLPDVGLGTSFVPATTLPDQALTSFIPDVTGVSPLVQTPEVIAATPAVPTVVAPSVVAPTLPSVVTPPVVSPTASLAVPGALPSVVTPPAASLVVPGAGLTVGGVEGSALPSLASPELVSPNPLAQTTGAYSTSSTVGGMVPPPVPQNQPIGPIMDEDFQRGRPIYDELAEDRYRGFRLGR